MGSGSGRAGVGVRRRRGVRVQVRARGPSLFSRRRAGSRRQTFDMQNDAGEFVDLYVPRKW